MNEETSTRPPRPWWKFGYVWLVISGPAAVAVAAVFTVWIALANPETLVAQDHSRRGAEMNRALMPAVQGRNHAVTPPGAAR